MSPAWWAAFGPADTSLRCGDSQHRLQWTDGTMRALDHPDAEGELVLAALGGDANPCLDLVMAWGRHCDDLNVLAIGPRSASDRLTISASVLDDIATVSGGAGLLPYGFANPVARSVSIGATVSRPGPVANLVTYTSSSAGAGPVAGHRGFRERDWMRQVLTRLRARCSVLALDQGRIRRQVMATANRLVRPAIYRRGAGWGGFAPVGSRARLVAGWGGFEVDQGRAELIRLLALGPPFQFRLSAAVAHAWSADGEQAGRAERARPALTAALSGRLAPAAAHWLDIDPDNVEVRIHDGARWGELALAKTAGASRLQARLPVGWLASVWAPGLAVVGGHLVVSVLDAAWPAARVLAVRSPGRDPVELSIRDDKGDWTVTSR